MGVTALADTSATFDVSTITSSLSDSAITALNSAVTGLTPVIVAIVALNLAVRLFRKFVA
jgi:hypothetical protein